MAPYAIIFVPCRECTHMAERWPVLLMARALDLGGSERQLAATARTLDRERFEPHVGCYHPEGIRAAELRAAGIPIVSFGIRSFRSPSLLTGAWQMSAYLRRHRIALVHPFDYPTVIFGVPVARLSGTPVVLSSQRGERAFFSRAWQRVFQWTDRLVDGVVVNSDFIRRELIESQGVPAHRVHLCYNGLDTGTFHAEDRRRMPGLAEAACVIGSVSVLRPEKSLDTLIAAFARLRPDHPGLKLAIVGSGESRDVLVAEAKRLGILDDCVFQPATANVADWYRSMDIYVLPSLSEAFSNALMEAIACGCCPVASNVGGNPEMVRDGDNGLLFEPGNAVELAAKLSLLIGRPELRAEMKAVGRRTIQETFTLDRAAARMGAIYQQFLTRNAG